MIACPNVRTMPERITLKISQETRPPLIKEPCSASVRPVKSLQVYTENLIDVDFDFDFIFLYILTCLILSNQSLCDIIFSFLKYMFDRSYLFSATSIVAFRNAEESLRRDKKEELNK